MTYPHILLVLLATSALAARFPLTVDNDTIDVAVVVEPELIVLSAASGRVLVLNVSARAWLASTWQLTQPRDHATAQLVHNRYVVVAGGYLGQIAFSRIDVFDTHNFSLPGIIGELSIPHSGAVSLLDTRTGSMLVMGGMSENSSSLDTVEHISVQNAAISVNPATTLPQALHGHQAAHSSGFLSVQGGITQQRPNPVQISANVYVSTNNGDSWFTMTEQLSLARTGVCATVALGRYLVIVGGLIFTPYNTTNEIDVIDTMTQRHVPGWGGSLRLRERRVWCSAAALGPYVYIAGGSDTSLQGSRILASVEVLDVRDGTLFYADNLTEARQDMVVAETGDAVYFIGGISSNAIDYYVCGNGRVDGNETCDIHMANCSRNCMGFTTTGPGMPSTRTGIVFGGWFMAIAASMLSSSLV